MKKLTLGLLLGLLLGCASSARDTAPLAERLADRNLQLGAAATDIRNYRINGWNSLDDRHLIVDTGPQSQYLVTLVMPCHDLRHSETVAFSSTTGRVTAFDSLLVQGAGDIVSRCPIDAIHELEPLQ